MLDADRHKRPPEPAPMRLLPGHLDAFKDIERRQERRARPQAHVAAAARPQRHVIPGSRPLLRRERTLGRGGGGWIPSAGTTQNVRTPHSQHCTSSWPE